MRFLIGGVNQKITDNHLFQIPKYLESVYFIKKING